MIQWAAKYFEGISPMFIDGLLYASIAIFQFLQTAFGSDEAGKFIDLQLLFYVKTAVGCTASGLLAIKLYRSTSYADHKEMKKNETAFLTREPKP